MSNDTRMTERETEEQFAAKHIDMWIGMYFNSKADREAYTLGEWIAHVAPALFNTRALAYLAKGKAKV